MPELPEMQALAERLDGRLAGARVGSLDVLQFSALKTVAPPPEALEGDVIAGCARRGKYLIVTLEPGRNVVLHLSQGGRVDVEDPAKSTRPRQAVVRLVAREPEGAAVVGILVKEFGKERKASCWILDADDPGPLDGLGPEPFDAEFEQLVLGGNDRRRLHTLLRDQRTVAGIGRGYTDDALHRARLSPFATLTTLDRGERERLLGAVRSVLDEALLHERRRTGGLPTKLGERFRVHRRRGEPCPECGRSLERVSYESYELVYCAKCQTGGKVLADRRTSKFLK